MESERRKKVALIQAIGTANPPTCYLQADYPELYFEITKSQHLPHLKDKLKRICKYTQLKIPDFVPFCTSFITGLTKKILSPSFLAKGRI